MHFVTYAISGCKRCKNHILQYNMPYLTATLKKTKSPTSSEKLPWSPKKMPKIEGAMTMPSANPYLEAAPDSNPQETQEWFDSLDAVLHFSGPQRSKEL